MKKFKLTKVIASLLMVTSILVLNSTGVNAEWKVNNMGWWYAESNSWATGWRIIDGKWYYFDSNGYMVHDTVIDGYRLGSDGSWVIVPPTASTTTTNSKTFEKKSIGFDEMILSSDTRSDLKQYYNQSCRVIDDINRLSITGKNYINTYKTGNILGKSSAYVWSKGDDYCFDLDNKFNRFTATVGIDDYYSTIGNDNINEAKQRIGTITIIGDGNVLETKNFQYGDGAVDVDVNIEGCSKLIIRMKINQWNIPSVYSYYDILNGKFYFK